MINFFELQRLNVETTSWNQIDGKYEIEYRGKLVVDKFAATYFFPDGTQAQQLVCSMFDYRSGQEVQIFDHKAFLDQAMSSTDSRSMKYDDRSPPVTPLDVELLIKLKQGGFTEDGLVTLRGAGII